MSWFDDVHVLILSEYLGFKLIFHLLKFPPFG